jgi:large subunit ribosomal protein L3
MAATILGRKVGMTRVYTGEGVSVPVTVVAAGPCFVSQIKSPQTDGYAAVQLAFDEVKPRRSTMPVIGQVGQPVTVDRFEGIKFVDVTGRSKGKGFAGVMKRHHFKGMFASHGTERKHRSPGSQSGHGNERGGTGGPKKGKKMPGHLGDERVTARSLDLVGIDKDNNLLLVRGSVPGSRNGLLVIREAVRLYKKKAKASAA